MVTLYLKDGRNETITTYVDMFNKAGKFCSCDMYIDNICLNLSCNIMDIIFDRSKGVHIVDGKHVKIKSYYNDEEDNKEVSKMEVDYMTFIKAVDKEIHYAV